MHNTAESLWLAFAHDENLTEHQLAQFKKYYELLIDWNERMNLTAITKLEAVINDHFRDAIQVLSTGAIAPSMRVCDVGSGAGIPGIPIALMR